MSEQLSTYRKDRRYVQTMASSGGVHERMVGPFRWLFYRVQVWRFEKFKSVDVLRERRLWP